MSHSTRKIEFGDFQTPDALAAHCCRAVARDFGQFSAVIEPTCGLGSFVRAAASVFRPQSIFANEVDDVYLVEARSRTDLGCRTSVDWSSEDFFDLDWRTVRDRYADQTTLFLGNPPWVTNSQLGSLGSSNLPTKRNIDGVRGIQALTGHGNFDISEYILRVILQSMRPGTDTFAFLVKTATARKLVRYAWNTDKHLAPLAFYGFDAKQQFGVSVDAVLVAGKLNSNESAPKTKPQYCFVSQSLDFPPKAIAMGWVDQRIVSDPENAAATQHLAGIKQGVWRSGIKHDASKILELRYIGGDLVNGLKETVRIESDRLYPLMKGSDVANGRNPNGDRFALVPQFQTNEDTSKLASQLPLTYGYLERHASIFARRKSSIYRKRDRFAIFGVGPYTFRPWKVAICGLYKRLQFSIYGPYETRPVVFDDTVYFVGTDTQEQARLLIQLLTSELASTFLESRLFWDAKRPITVDLLQSLDLEAVACAVGKHDLWMGSEIDRLFSSKGSVSHQRLKLPITAEPCLGGQLTNTKMGLD